MSFLAKVWTAIRNPLRYAGRDLEGNKFYEKAAPSGLGRPRRTVVYKDPEDMWDYIGGQRRLPIQWSAWLAHTRPNPPTFEELKADMERQLRVRHNASLIEARDREESEALKQIQAEKHNELLAASLQGRDSKAPHASDSVASTSEAPAPPTQDTAKGTAVQQETHDGQPSSTDPWAASRNAPETESWTPKRRRRGE